MKTILKSIVTLAMVALVAGNVFAAFRFNNVTFSFSPIENNQKALLKVFAPEKSLLVAEIRELNGAVVYTELVKGGKMHMQKFDFSKLTTGNYVVIVKGNDFFISQPFEMTVNGTFAVANEPKAEFFRPIVAYKDSQLTVRMAGTVSDRAVTVRLYNTAGEVVFEESLTAAELNQKLFNVAQLPKGNYTVAVSSSLHEFEKSIVF